MTSTRTSRTVATPGRVAHTTLRLGTLAVLAGCTALTGCTGAAPEPTASAPATATAAEPSPAATPTAPAETPVPTPAAAAGEAVDVGGVEVAPRDESVTADDVALVADLVRFAQEPSAAAAGRLPLADEVELGLGPELVTTLGADAAVDLDAWAMTDDGFRARTGSFSAPARVAEHLASDASSGVIDPDRLVVSVGEHAHCESASVPPPDGFTDHRRVSVQPADDALGTCIAWFTVDLFVDEDGEVDAVTLDLWEP